MRNLIFVFLGGGVGSALRYLTIVAVHRWWTASFPVGVLIANLAGSFVLGFLFGWPAMRTRQPDVWLFTTTGILGGYTTFSTLTNDSWHLLLNQHPLLALLNALGSVGAGILAAAFGWQVARILFQ